MRGKLEAEKSKLRDLEDLLQALRAKEHAAVNAEQAAATDSVGLHQRLQAALNENDKNVQVSAFSAHSEGLIDTYPRINTRMHSPVLVQEST